ncbi:MAG: zinc-dependent metalloprotease family protein [Flavobacteriales bacterium]|nr:zinc-dependent metalloprotease family protein [Flavobacteriales bacterium]
MSIRAVLIWVVLNLCGASISAQVAPVRLFSEIDLSAVQQPTFKASNALGLDLDEAAFEQLRKEKPDRVKIVIPLPGLGEQTLRFNRFDVKSEGFEVGVTEHGQFRTVQAQPSLVCYELTGEAGGGSFFLMADHVLGSMNIGNQQYEINPRMDPEDRGVHAVFRVADATDQRTFTCGLDEALEKHAPQEDRDPNAQRSSVMDCIEIGLEIDQYTYEQLGSNVQTTIDWGMALVSAVDVIYRAELDDLVNMTTRFIHIWISEDPYVNIIYDGNANLFAFVQEWDSNPNLSAVPIDLKHFITMRSNTGVGGVSFLGQICNYYNASLSSFLSGGSTYTTGTYDWNLNVFAHEMGHACGAHHTHWCGWPGGPIDNCTSLEGACDGYVDNPTAQSGTIMSYCNYSSGGTVLEFHPVVETTALIPTLSAATCIGSCAALDTAFTALFCGDPEACNYEAGAPNNDDCHHPGDCAFCYGDGSVGGGIGVSGLTATLAGGESELSTFAALGTPDFMNISIDFDNVASPATWASDILISLCDPSGSCVEVGGDTYSPGYTIMGHWPSTWGSGDDGLYTATVNWTGSTLSGTGDWTVGVWNGWGWSSDVTVTVDVEFTGLCNIPPPVPGCTDSLSCNFNDLATEDDGTCLYNDVCGLCDGPGAVYACDCSEMPSGDCDCDGNVPDAAGVCGGDCIADTNGNGVCDADELCPDTDCLGDLNGDNMVTVSDVLTLLGQFGSDCN